MSTLAFQTETTMRSRAVTRTARLLKFVANFGFGGTERQFVNLGLALEPSRFAVHFGCLRLWGELLQEINTRGLPVIDYRVSTFKSPRLLAGQMRLARDIRRRRIDIVHSYNFYANIFALPAAKLAGARTVASIRDLGVYLGPNDRRLQRFACRFADRILVNAKAIREQLIADGYDGRRITVIPNGIDLARFDQHGRAGTLRRELAVPDGAPLVGVVGRVKPLKGIEDFLTAASLIAQRHPAARFLIVGGSMEDGYVRELAALATKLGIGERVIFTGFRGDVERILPELSVSVLPSHSEGLSNTLIESMAAGIPTVATTVGDSIEVVRDGENGMLVPPGHPTDIAEAVNRLLDDSLLAARLGAAGRHSVIEQFSIDRMVERTGLFYESLLTS